MSEHDEQAALFAWASFNEDLIPQLAMLYAIPNGGQRHVLVARKLKAEGVKAGVWDVALDVPNATKHGLRIEMKFGKNDLTDNQIAWGEMYRRYGYATAVCYTWEEAKAAILAYLRNEDDPQTGHQAGN